MQRLAPEKVEVLARVLLRPVLPDEVVSGNVRLACQDGDEFVRCFAVIERLN